MLAIDGREGSLLWRHKTKGYNMGGMAAVDIRKNGGMDAIVPSEDGSVYALAGDDGTILWKRPLGDTGGRSIPTVVDLNSDGVLDVAVLSKSGVLWLLDGLKGDVLGTAEGGPGAAGRPSAVLSPTGELLIICPMGTAGVVALDWTHRVNKWQVRTKAPVVASPIVCDLEGDGQKEVIVTTAWGEMEVLDLQTGEWIWGFRVGDGGIEADPAVADLDGDGVLDIVVADHGHGLHAILGVGNRGGRKRMTRTQEF
jgi:outer membrane protein assembly factor BamB